MDNLGDWIYIVFLVIAGLSGLINSARKKKEAAEAPVPPAYEEENNPGTEKSFWDLLDEMQKEQQSPVEKPKSPIPFLAAEQKIHTATPPRHSAVLPSEDEAPGIDIEQDFQDPESLRKAVIYTEILNRKY